MTRNDVADIRLLTEAEAALELGLPERSLRDIRGRKEISFRRHGVRGVRYMRADLVEFVERMRVGVE